MVSVLQQYLDSIGVLPRLQEHKEALQGRGLIDVLTGYPQKSTLGLGLEASGNIGEGLAGLLSVLGSYIYADNPDTQETARRVREAGFLHPLRAQEAARTGPDDVWAWIAGAGGMALDPTNFIGKPVGAAADASKLEFLQRMMSASATPSKGFAENIAADAGAELDTLIARLQGQVDTLVGEEKYARALERLNAPAPTPLMDGNLLAEIQGREPLDVSPLKGLLEGAPETYKATQAAKQAAATRVARDMLSEGGTKPVPRGAISALRGSPTPEYLAAVDEAKTAATPQGPGLPRRGETPLQYRQSLREAIARLEAEEADAVGKLRARLEKPPVSPLTPEDIRFGPKGEPLGTLAEMGPERPLPNALSELNATMNTLPGGPEYVPPQEPGLLAPERVPGWAGKERPGFAGDVTARDYIEEEVRGLTEASQALDGSRPALERGYAGRAWDLIRTAIDEGLFAGQTGRLLKLAAKEGLKEQKAALARPWSGNVMKGLGSVWSGIQIQTPRNIFMDMAYSRWVLKNEGIAKRARVANERMIIDRLEKGEGKQHLLFGSLGNFLNVLGVDVDSPKLVDEITRKLGANFFDIEADTLRQLETMNLFQQALYGTAVQVANPTRAVTGLATAPLNLLIPMRQKMFHIINNVTHVAARVAAFEQAFAPFIQNSAEEFLSQAAKQGKDVSALRGKVLQSADEVIATEGGFSHQLVKEVLGERYAKEWEAISNQALDAGYANSRRVLGNYQQEGISGTVENTIRKFVPFMSWAWRAYPRTAKYAMQHPAITAGTLHLFEADRKLAEREGRPAYQVGTLKVDEETPFLGLLASAFTPEQEGELRVNPLALFSPVGGELIGAGMEGEPEAETGYQQAAKLLGYVGGSFNPLVQAGAYVAGQDWRAPSSASRYGAVDALVGDITGEEVPTVQGPLRAARALTTEALTGEAEVDTYDAAAAKANELVLEETGLPVSHPSNKPLALDIRNKGPLYQRAERALLEGGARRALFNAASPQTAMANTETKVEQRAAGQAPFSYDDIAAARAEGLPRVVRTMEALNAAFYAENPAAAVQVRPEFTARELMDPRLARWEEEHLFLKQLAPRSYARARDEFKDALGIR